VFATSAAWDVVRTVVWAVESDASAKEEVTGILVVSIVGDSDVVTDVLLLESLLTISCVVLLTSTNEVVVVVVVSISSKLMSTLEDPSGSSWSRPGF